MGIINNKINIHSKTFTIEETDFLIQTLSAASINIGQAKVAASVMDKIMTLHQELIKKTVEI